MDEAGARAGIVAGALELERLGLNHGSAGNLSLRTGEFAFVTPSGVPARELVPEQIARMRIGDAGGAFGGPLPPSSEWRFHLDLYAARGDVGAVVHMHSTYATTLATLRRAIPAVHYMIAAFGGPTVPCVGYASYGTPELSALVVEGLKDRDGALLANHGAIVTGSDMRKALWRAVELEALAQVYYLGALAGEPVVLPDDEIWRTVERFKNYGPRSDA
ncbi:class II aldolase/adducin family protein [Methylocystis parvus]|uniref:Class II aldolase n=1 Tax=Methylocystis parvus TaxID=134 RepID=A0A6B8M3D8_9HYPH|nr:class II aldolase/adducin family protein [Methylocystis parvus]QGM99467.1 class II aldolase [Methylocystis parvus]WBK02154.1 class II aldolase/adducin family protein [Methylocystis parvus OBBP]